jgi:hypothetical protein
MKPKENLTMNDNLSRAASAVARLHREEDEACQDIDAFFAPSECYTLVTRAVERRINEALALFGFTRHSYNEALDQRVSGRFIYERNLAVEEL